MLTIIEILKLIEKNFILIGIVLSVSYILYSVALYYLFEKIGVNKNKGLIPVLNLITLLDLIDIPKWMVLLYLIPYVNIIGIPFMTLVVALNLKNNLRLNKIDVIGLIILAPIYLLIISNKDISYIKIDHNRKLVKDKIVIVKEDNIIDLPSLNINLDNYSNIEAYDATKFVSDKNNFIQKKNEFVDDKPNEVASLTYDYNEMYKDNK